MLPGSRPVEMGHPWFEDDPALTSPNLGLPDAADVER
jgi:hypothetical protein